MVKIRKTILTGIVIAGFYFFIFSIFNVTGFIRYLDEYVNNGNILADSFLQINRGYTAGGEKKKAIIKPGEKIILCGFEDDGNIIIRENGFAQVKKSGLSSEKKHGGDKSLRIEVDMQRSWSNVDVVFKEPLDTGEYPVKSIGMWIIGGGIDGKIHVLLHDEKGREFNITLCYEVNYADWHYVEVDIPKDIQWPCKLVSLSLWAREPSDDVFFFDDLTIILDDTADEAKKLIDEQFVVSILKCQPVFVQKRILLKKGKRTLLNVLVENPLNKVSQVSLKCVSNSDYISFFPIKNNIKLKPGESTEIIVSVAASDTFFEKDVSTYEIVEMALFIDDKEVQRKRISIAKFRQHPFVATNEVKLAKIKKHIAEYDWAKQAYKQLLASGNSVLNTHNKINPSRQEGNYGEHWRIAHDCEILGWCYALSGEKKYAKKVKKWLMEYPEFFTNLPYQKEIRLGDGRLGAFSLIDAEILPYFFLGYDLVYNAPIWEEKERRELEEKFFYPSLETFRTPETKIWNRINGRAFFNNAIGTLGFVLQDGVLIDEALNGKGEGFRFMIARDMLDDGLWNEAATAYGAYTIDAFSELADASSNYGINLFKEEYESLSSPITGKPANPFLKKNLGMMFVGLVDLTFPNRTFPQMGDGGSYLSKLPSEIFYKIYYYYPDNPAFIWGLYGGKKSLVKDFKYLLSGLGQINENVLVTRQSRSFDSAGIAILRAGGGTGIDSLEVILSYRPWANHAHYDALNIIFYGKDKVLLTDGNRGVYFHETLAHNTVMVDGKSQGRTSGECLLYEDKGLLKVVSVRSSTYSEVEHIRTLLLSDTYLLVLDGMKSNSRHLYSWLAHTQGDFLGKLISMDRSSFLNKTIKLLGRIEKQEVNFSNGLSIKFLQPQDGQLYLMKAPGKENDSLESLISFNREASNIQFVTLITAEKGSTIKAMVENVGNNLKIMVHDQSNQDQIILSDKGNITFLREDNDGKEYFQEISCKDEKK